MATRFGASSPARAYAAKVRLLVSCLVAVIFILLVSLVVSLQAPSSPVASSVEPAVASNPSQSFTNILIATQRLEEGVQLVDSMLGVQPMAAEALPIGHVKESERNLVVGRFTTAIVPPNQPILRELISETRPISSIPIPPGFRAVAIEVDSRTSVEGWARPNTRVDVLLAYADKDGQKKVATIVRFSKVLSVGGNTGGEGSGKFSTITLLVSEKDAKKVELARTVGTLSLSLVGGQESGVEDGTGIVDLSTILGTDYGVEKATEEPILGTMYSTDPTTGRQVKYVLGKNGKWKKAADE